MKEESQKGETLEAHFSGVYQGIFVFSTPLDSCGQGELVGAVLKARFARLENRSFRSLRSIETLKAHFSGVCGWIFNFFFSLISC